MKDTSSLLLYFWPKMERLKFNDVVTSENPKFREILQNNWPVPFKNVKVITKTEKIFQHEGDLRKCHTYSWIGSWFRKRTLMRQLGKF